MPHGSMGKTKHHALFVLIAGAAVAFSALVVADFVAPSPETTLSLLDLDRAHQTVLSCGERESTGGELMWCSDPSSPQCIPAAPPSPAPDFSDNSAPAALLVGRASRLGYTLVPWPVPVLVSVNGRSDHPRLERPPRV